MFPARFERWLKTSKMRPPRNWCRIFTTCETHSNGTLRLPRNLVSSHVVRRRFFFAMLKNVHYAKAAFTKSPTHSPHPPKPVSVVNQTQPECYPQLKNFSDSLSGFFAHEYFKSRAILKKYHCSRKVLFFVLQKWRLLHTHTLKNRYEGVNPLKLPLLSSSGYATGIIPYA